MLLYNDISDVVQYECNPSNAKYFQLALISVVEIYVQYVLYSANNIFLKKKLSDYLALVESCPKFIVNK